MFTSTVPFTERGGVLRGCLDLASGRFPAFVFGGRVGALLPVFHFHEVTRADLEPKLRHLAENGYRTVTSDDIADYARGRLRLAPRSVALCFDDAWASLADVAAPLLSQYGLTAIAYAIPARIAEAAGADTPFVAWPQLAALHASGVVDVQSHTWSHSMIFCGDRPIAFVGPGYGATPLLNRPRVAAAPSLRFVTPFDLGAPLYPARSRMSDARRAEVPLSSHEAAVALVAREGGPHFFARPDWKARLEAVTRPGGPVAVETEAEQLRAVEDELARAKAVLNDRLRTQSVRHLCLPWGVAGATTASLLERVGYRSAFANRMRGVHAVAAGDDPVLAQAAAEQVHLPAARTRSALLVRLLRTRGRVSGKPFSFAANSVYATVSAGSAGLLLILLMVAGRLLTAADYGRFSYALALATILETVMDIGLGHVTVRAVAREKTRAGRIFQEVLGLKLVWIGIGLALLVVVAPILRHDAALVRTCYLLGCSSAVRSYLLTVRGLLQGVDRFDLEAATVFADRLILLALGSLALAGGYGLNGLTLSFVVGRLIIFVVVTIVVRRVTGSGRPRFDRDVWRDLQAAALPLGFFMIALNLYTYIDTVILGVMRTDVETGWYAAAYRVYEGLTYAPSVLAAVLTPRLSYLFVTDRGAMRSLVVRVLALAAALGVVLGGMAMWLARPIVTLLFGPAYAAAAAPLQILAGGAVFVFCTWILHAAAIGTNLDRRLVSTTLVGLGSNVILNLLFIPRWGIRGAASATVVAEAATVGLLLLQVRRRLRLEPAQDAP